jgi:hypothetical protein
MNSTDYVDWTKATAASLPNLRHGSAAIDPRKPDQT